MLQTHDPPTPMTFPLPTGRRQRRALTLDDIRTGTADGAKLEVVKVSELAGITRLSEQTIRNEIRNGELIPLPGRRQHDDRRPFMVSIAEARRYLRKLGVLMD